MASALQFLLAVAYPFVVYVGLERLGPRELGLGLLLLSVLRIALVAPSRILDYVHSFWMPALSVVVVAAAAAASDDPLALLLAPTLVSWTLLGVFAHSLFRGPPLIERLARVRAGHLSMEQQAYCRTVTLVWCGFFALNGAIALFLALFAAVGVWASYTGFGAYLLIGALFLIELAVRHYRFRLYVGGIGDAFFRWLFPPRVRVPAPGRMDPEVLSSDGDATSRNIRLRVPNDLACWPGHFPEYSLVPGVFQLDWAIRFSEMWIGRELEVRGIRDLKFKTPIRPGQKLNLYLERDPKRDGFRFRLEDGDKIFSLGRILLGDDEAQEAS